MKVKKILKIVGVIVLILLASFIIHGIKNFIIISKLQNKISEYINSNNYHYNVISYENNNKAIISDYYKKDNNRAVFIEDQRNENRKKLSLYKNEENTHLFVEIGAEKTLKILDSESTALPDIPSVLDTDNSWQTFLCSTICTITSTKYNEKDCYKIKNYLSPFYAVSYGTKLTLIIDKDTGLLLKSIEGEEITERTYEFNNVDDSIFVKPDINQYKEIKDN